MPMMKDNNEEEEDTDKDINIRKLVAVVIFAGSVLMGTSMLFPSDSEYRFIIRGLGISIIGGAFIAWAITHVINRYNIKKMLDHMEAINENIRKTFKLIKECEDNHLLKIYEPCDMIFRLEGSEQRPSNEFKKDIKELLSKEDKEIKIYGISLRLFLNDGVEFWRPMLGAFDRTNENKVKIKILLLSPYSEWAKQREKAEREFRDTLMFDSVTSIRWLRRRLGNYENRKEMYDNIRFYDAAPDFFLFITSECVIFEIYHMGISQLKRETHRHVPVLGLGGHVPVFQFDNSSSMYKYLDAHFEYLFGKEIDGEPNKYHAGTLKEMLERLKKEPIKKANSE